MTSPRRRYAERTAAGRLLQDRRLALGLTQRDVADLAGVGISSVRAAEAGSANVTLSTALRVVDALGLVIAVGPRPVLSAIPEVAVLERGAG